MVDAYARNRAAECRKAVIVIAACQTQISKLSDPEQQGDPTNEAESTLLWLEKSLEFASHAMYEEMQSWEDLALQPRTM